jgi:ankyrin repeat protein
MDLRRNDIGCAADKTCAWFLKHQNYSTWLGQRHGLLWVKGKPGAGKSTVMETALCNVERQASEDGLIVASFFFHGRGSHMQRSPIGLFRSLLHQILRKIPPLLSKFCLEFKRKRETQGEAGKAWVWHENELQKFLESEVMDISKTYPIKIFVDALDECGEKLGRRLVSDFQRLSSKLPATRSALSICFSCRHYPVMDLEGDGLEICVEKENIADIANYVTHKLQAVSLDPEERKLLEGDILNKASGVFLWVVLVVPVILDLVTNGMNIKATREELKKIPSELGNVYQDILRNLSKEDRPKSLQLIQWICLAEEPLSLDELRFAMGFDADAPHQSLRVWEDSMDYVKDGKQMERRVKALSGGLVEVVERAGHVTQFIHQSVKDYFMHGGLQRLEEKSFKDSFIRGGLRGRDGISSNSTLGRGHHRLSRSCIKYFTTNEVLRSISEQSRGDLKKIPFLRYAVINWVSHSRKAEIQNISQEDLLCHFQWPSDYILDCWISAYNKLTLLSEFASGTTFLHVASMNGLLSVLSAIFNSDKGASPDPKDSNSRTPLSWAATNGHMGVVKLLLRQDIVLDSKDSRYGRTPLSWAVKHGHQAVVKLLIENGANPDSKSRFNRTPLLFAAENEDEALVKLLLENGACPDSKDSEYGHTPLLLAAMNGDEAIVKLLLEKNAELQSQESRYGQTPLWWAANRGSKAIVKLLLDKGADRNSKSSSGQTPLSWAADNWRWPMVELLLETGANPNMMSSFDQRPLWFAARSGYEAGMKLLLEKGAHPDSKDSKFGRTPLSWAAAHGRVALVKLLLKNGANPDSQSSSNRTPLLFAAENGHEAVVKLLLENGADPDSKDSNSRTPLSWAATNGHMGVVKLLLQKDIALDSKDSRYARTPLSWAAGHGYQAVVKLLLENGANPNSKSSSDRMPLLLAAENGHEVVMKLLLENGVYLDPKDSKYGRTPLSWAAMNGHEAAVKLLLENGANPDSKDSKYGRTPLSWAAMYGFEAVIKLLLEKAVDPDSQSSSGQTPLLLAVENGNEAVVKLLLENGAKPDSESSYDWTPLSFAAQGGHEAMTKLLLEKGAKPDCKLNSGKTPLSWAARNGHEAIVKLLLENGADPASQDSEYGQTPLSWAVTYGHEAVIKLLLEKDATLD